MSLFTVLHLRPALGARASRDERARGPAPARDSTERAVDDLYVRISLARERGRMGVRVLRGSRAAFRPPAGSAFEIRPSRVNTRQVQRYHNDTVGRVGHGLSSRRTGVSYHGTRQTLAQVVGAGGIFPSHPGGGHDLNMHASGWGRPQDFVSTSQDAAIARERFARPAAENNAVGRDASVFAVCGTGTDVNTVVGPHEHQDELEVAYADRVVPRQVLVHTTLRHGAPEGPGRELTLSRCLFWQEGRYRLHAQAVEMVAGVLAIDRTAAAEILGRVLHALRDQAVVAVQRAVRRHASPPREGSTARESFRWPLALPSLPERNASQLVREALSRLLEAPSTFRPADALRRWRRYGSESP